MQRKTSSILICLLALAASCNCAFAACPSGDLNGDCLVNFLDFQIMAGRGSLLDLDALAGQWLESDDEPPAILSRADMQSDDPNGPNLFAVELVVVGKQRVGRTVFRYECQVILTNLSADYLNNVHLVMVGWPDNMTIIDQHVTFGDAEIAPGESAGSMDTCAFTVNRSILINPLEIIWRYVTAPQDMTFIPGGAFQMGDNLGDGYSDVLPVHTVTVDSFYMGRCEVTNGQYCDYLNSALSQGLITVTSGVVYKAGSGTTYPYCDTSTADSYSQIAYSAGVFSVRTKNGRDMSNDPMVEVSWYGAAAYCNWRSQQEGKEQCYNLSTWNCDFAKHGYRLATEAEWEYAARGGLSGRRFPWGDTISHSQANYYSYWEGGHPYYPYDVNPAQGYHPSWDDVYPYTSPGGSFAANGYGIYDMAGNVWEWCNDWYDSDYYDSSPTSNPTGPITGSVRVLRGGCWGLDAFYCRVAGRGDAHGGGWPGNRYDIIGFRLVLDFN
ncbi:MAG: formylglycine-generating enzyme family protein [Sedimentisphaerales bacterium]|nr:formylglycine-generating enzyme family protein [Sedimentisphaerales bacterium]